MQKHSSRLIREAWTTGKPFMSTRTFSVILCPTTFPMRPQPWRLWSDCAGASYRTWPRSSSGMARKRLSCTTLQAACSSCAKVRVTVLQFHVHLTSGLCVSVVFFLGSPRPLPSQALSVWHFGTLAGLPLSVSAHSRSAFFCMPRV